MLAGYTMEAHIMGQSPQELPTVYGVSQQVSANVQRRIPSVCQTEFNSSPFTPKHCLLPHVAGDSFPPIASSPLIHQPSLDSSLAGPSTLPSQGVLEKSPPLPSL